MTHVVSDGVSTMRAAGQKMRDGAGAATHGVHEGINGIRQHGEHPVVQKRTQFARNSRKVELMGSAAGALAAFFVSRLVRAMLRRHGE